MISYNNLKELEEITDEFKHFMQHLLDLLLNTLMLYKVDDVDFIIFKMPVS